MRINRVFARYALFAGLTFVPAALVQVLAPCAHAQVTSGTLVGVVKDATGAAVPNATIVVTNEATGTTSKVVTNGQGQYRVDDLLPGLYDATSAAQGFSNVSVTRIQVVLNTSVTRDFTMSVGASTTTVEVTSDAGLALDTTTQNLSTTFEMQELGTLPVTSIGQGVLNTSLLAPGVGSTGGIGIGVGPSIAGNRQRDNNFTIEGIDNNNKAVTGPLVYVPNDDVGEFTLITGQFSPEFGHSSAGQFNTNLVTGTNKFHGKIYEYFQNRNLNAAFGTAGNKLPNARYDYNRYGAELGGPVVHNHLFFFSAFERQTVGRNTQYSVCVPDAAGRSTLQSYATQPGFSTTNINEYLQNTPSANSSNAVAVCGLSSIALYDGPSPAIAPLTGAPAASTLATVSVGVYNINSPIYANNYALAEGVDYTLSANDSFRARYIYNTFPAFDTAATLPAFYTQNPFKYHLIALSEFHTFTPNLINELRVGFNRYANDTIVGPQTYTGLDAFPNLQFSDLSGSVTSQIGPDPNAPQFTIQNTYQLTDNISYTHGRHTLKFGFDGRKYISPQGFTQRARGDYEYTNTSDFLRDYAPDALGERSSGSHTYYGDQTAFYGYGNDTWRATDQITLNLGLRYEFTSVPVGERAQALNSVANVPGLITFHAPQPSYTGFAPRAGMEYAPDAKTSVRAGYGIAYDVLFDNLGTLSFPPQYSATQDVATYDPTCNKTNCTPAEAQTYNCNTYPPAIGCPNFLAGGGLKAASGSGVAVLSHADAVALTSAYLPDQILPYTQTYSLTIQRQIGHGLTAEIGYIGTHAVHLPVQQRMNRQSEVNSTNYLPTYVNGVAINGQGSQATNTAAISYKGANYVPAFYKAGFVSNITSYQPYGGSNYNGLITNLQGRMRNGLQLQLSYTWSRTMDNSTAEVFATSLSPRRPQDPQNFSADYSRSGLSRTHRLTLEADYDVKAFKGRNWLLQNVVGNWNISPIYTYESPEYATVLNGSNALNTGDGAYVGRTIYNPHGVKNTWSTVTPVLDGSGNTTGYTATNPTAMYIQAGLGALPNSERNTLAGRPTDNLDLAIYKRFTAFERYSVEIGAQALNALNHAQYIPGSVDDVGTYSYTGTAYQTIGTDFFGHPEQAFGNNPRNIQLSAKLIF